MEADTGKDAAASVHVVKSVASESYMGACDFAHEVHAGIGVMREYGLTSDGAPTSSARRAKFGQ